MEIGEVGGNDSTCWLAGADGTADIGGSNCLLVICWSTFPKRYPASVYLFDQTFPQSTFATSNTLRLLTEEQPSTKVRIPRCFDFEYNLSHLKIRYPD